MTHKNLLVTGGAGFIGSAVVRQVLAETDWNVLNVDCLTYAGNLASVAMCESDPRYQFTKLDITDYAGIEKAVAAFQPDYVLHLAAESHVDRSIDSTSPFIQTNIVGTHSMLEACTAYWRAMDDERKNEFSFSSRVYRRGVWIPRRNRPFLRNHAVPAKFAVLGQ